MSNRDFLFIVEGNSDEPAFIRKLFEKCSAKQAYKTYTYATTLHTLAKHLEEDYPEFDTDEIDIQLILRSYEKDETKKAMLCNHYTDIFLIFDYEPHHKSPHFETIRRMLCVFTDSTQQGKLFINYPMMQSYKHFAFLPDDHFYDVVVTKEACKQYKRFIGDFSGYRDINKYTYPLFFSLAVHHLKKANYILTNQYELPDKNNYLAWKLVDVFDKEMSLLNTSKLISVLNTAIFILIDYKPTDFYRQLTNKAGQFQI